MNCRINLRESFGGEYRITFDEAYEPAHVPIEKRDPWMMQIPCAGRGITIYPYGSTVLAIEVDRRPSIAAKLTALNGLRLHQDGDVERTYLFDLSLFDQVAEIVKPRKRRILTETQLQALARHAFQGRDGARKSTPKRAPTPPADIPITQA